MEDLQHVPEGIVSVGSAVLRRSWLKFGTFHVSRSYWTWGILLFLIIFTQILGVGEKVWIKVSASPLYLSLPLSHKSIDLG